MRKLLAAMAVALMAVGCSTTAGDDSGEAGATPSVTATAAEAPSPSPTPEVAQPEPTVSLEWTFTDPDAVLVRFVAFLKNPGSQPLVGVETEWVAYDEAGSIVGSFRSQRPPIGPAETFPYAGGAGGANLSGVPARVEVNIVDPGRLADVEVARLETSEITLEDEEFSQDELEYRVEATVAAGSEEVASDSIDVIIVLRDEAGSVVGGTFHKPDNLPSTIAAGSTFRISAEFIPATAEPATAEVVAVA